MSNIKNWEQIEQLISKIVQQYNLTQNKLYTKSRGGLVPTRLLADRYDCPNIIVDAKEIPDEAVFVDDIYDTGKTYQEISNIAKNNFTYITLYLRRGQKPPTNLIYAEQTQGNEYIVFPWDKKEYEKNNLK